MENRRIFTKSNACDSMYSWIFPLLPEKVKAEIENADKSVLCGLSEIRLRAGGVSGVTSDGINYVFNLDGISERITSPLLLCHGDIDDFIFKVCNGSVFSHENTIAGGYVTVKGVRIGICGDAIVKNTEVSGFSRIQGVNIRLPRHIDGCADSLIKQISLDGFNGIKGFLVASAPGVGKTTVLRELAIKLSGGMRNMKEGSRMYRVSVIDERCELYIPSLFSLSCADIYCGIPKHKGIEYASRTMSPEVIIFDEIGSEAEAKSVITAHFGGISFISSVHAGSVETVRQKKMIKCLLDEGIFTHIYFLERTENGVKGTLHKVSEC